jgi:glycosyltransferase involved in cell wall biosynthesis
MLTQNDPPGACDLQSVIFVGPYYTDEIFAQRRLPSRNSAGGNRVINLAAALKTQIDDVVVVSPAVAMSMGWSGRVIHHRSSTVVKQVRVAYPTALGLPILGLVIAPFQLIMELRAELKTRRKPVVVFYNYTLPHIISAVYLRLIHRTRICFDVEDICTVRFADWLGRGDARPIFQAIGTLSLKIATLTSDLLLIPCRGFKRFLGSSQNIEVIGGCVDIPPNATPLRRNDGFINLLFSGTLNNENGIHIFIDALKRWDLAPPQSIRVKVDICGFSTEIETLKKAVARLTTLQVRVHGMVDDAAYHDLLERADLCFALQDPGGRHSDQKTPSKIYDFMAMGKAVLLTDVGDLSLVPENARYILRRYDVDGLVEALNAIVAGDCYAVGEQALCYARAHFSMEGCGSRLAQLMNPLVLR